MKDKIILGTELCCGIHDRKLTFLPLGTKWHAVSLREYHTHLYIERDGDYELWALSPRGDSYMAPAFKLNEVHPAVIVDNDGNIVTRIFT